MEHCGIKRLDSILLVLKILKNVEMEVYYMKYMKKILKIAVIIGVWLICYGVLLPDVNYIVRARGEKLFEQSVLYLVPLFTTGIVLNAECLYEGIRNKKKINKWMLLMFAVVFLAACIVPALCLWGDLRTQAVQSGRLDVPFTYSGFWVKLATTMMYGQFYLILWLCSGYLLTCIFDD